MANIIQIKRGLKASLPALRAGEPALCTDTKEVYIGSSTGNIKLANDEQLAQIKTIGVYANSVLQSIPNNIMTELSFTSIVKDNILIEKQSNNLNFKFKNSGLYEINLNVSSETQSFAGSRRCIVKINGVFIAGASKEADSLFGLTELTLLRKLNISNNDILSFEFGHNAGFPLLVDAVLYANYLGEGY